MHDRIKELLDIANHEAYFLKSQAIAKSWNQENSEEIEDEQSIVFEIFAELIVNDCVSILMKSGLEACMKPKNDYGLSSQDYLISLALKKAAHKINAKYGIEKN